MVALTKSCRIEMRVDPETEALVSEAAAAVHESVSSFVARAARAEADRVLARAEVTLIPAAQFDEMIAALDSGEPIPALAAEAARPRRFSRG